MKQKNNVVNHTLQFCKHLFSSTGKLDYNLLSTTTSLGRVRGFTIDLLYYLKSGPKRCCELVQITGKYHDYVHSYLRNMRNYGLVEKDGVFWKLSDLGANFQAYLDIVYNNIIEYGKKKERKKKERGKKKESSLPKKSEQLSLSLFLRDSSLDDTEKEVVEVLVNHYNKTGSKFILVKNQYDLADRLKKNPQDIIKALANLRQENIIYLYRSTLEGYWKIGLKKHFIKLLESSPK